MLGKCLHGYLQKSNQQSLWAWFMLPDVYRLVNRELVPWVPDDDGLALEDLTLTSQAKKGGHWDQFAANKAQFGVQTSFDEDVSPFPMTNKHASEATTEPGALLGKDQQEIRQKMFECVDS